MGNNTYVPSKNKINMILKYHIYIRNHIFSRRTHQHPKSPQWDPKFKTVRETDQYHQPHQREHWDVQKSYNPFHDKKQESISDLVMIINKRNDSVNNTDHEVKDDNVQNTIYNRRIDHTTTAKVVNDIFFTKYTLDTRQEEQNSVIS